MATPVRIWDIDVENEMQLLRTRSSGSRRKSAQWVLGERASLITPVRRSEGHCKTPPIPDPTSPLQIRSLVTGGIEKPISLQKVVEVCMDRIPRRKNEAVKFVMVRTGFENGWNKLMVSLHSAFEDAGIPFESGMVEDRFKMFQIVVFDRQWELIMGISLLRHDRMVKMCIDQSLRPWIAAHVSQLEGMPWMVAVCGKEAPVHLETGRVFYPGTKSKEDDCLLDELVRIQIDFHSVLCLSLHDSEETCVTWLVQLIRAAAMEPFQRDIPRRGLIARKGTKKHTGASGIFTALVAEIPGISPAAASGIATRFETLSSLLEFLETDAQTAVRELSGLPIVRQKGIRSLGPALATRIVTIFLQTPQSRKPATV